MNKLSLEKTEKVREEIKNSLFTNVLMLGHCCLKSFPEQILKQEYVVNLRRLDLSSNCIAVIPSSISVLISLRELWLSNNPIEKFPSKIDQLKKLELIDISNTKISEVPTELSLLEHLYDLDWRSTPLSTSLSRQHGVAENDIFGLRKLLTDQHTRKTLETELFDFLSGEHYLLDADKPGSKGDINALVESVSAIFDDLEEMKQFVRRAGKMLPARIAEVRPGTVERSKQLFEDFRRDTDRSRLAADVEIKIRGMYFDRIERAAVAVLLDSIYRSVKSLEDMQFLVQYASQLLPPDPAHATGEAVWYNILELQQELTTKRENAIQSLSAAMCQLFPEQLPDTVKDKARQVAKYFQSERFATKKELTKMSQLSAECAKVFPPDFASVDPEEVVRAVSSEMNEHTIL